MSYRAFVAVDVPPLAGVRALLSELARLQGVKPVQAENLHLTLRFLGQTPEAATPALEAALRASARGIPPFDASVQGVGAFPERGAPRVVWARIGEGAQTLRALAERFAAQSRERDLALGDDKPFKAHLTLARVRDATGAREAERFLATAQARASQARPEGFRVEAVHLKRSTLTPSGPRYETVVTAPLGAA